MDILVYGAGAVGGYLGGRLAQHGHQVTLIARQVTADLINANGLTITEAGATVRTRPTAVTSIAQAFMGGRSYDLILLTMKAYDLAAAVDPLLAFASSTAMILPVQNGIDVERPLIEQFGPARVVVGALTTPISKESGNSLIVERSDRGLALAPAARGQNIKPWIQLMRQAGIPVKRVRDYEAMKWSKALLNIIGNATSAILNRPPGVVYASTAVFDLEMRMLRETLAVMRERRIRVVNLPGSPARSLARLLRWAPRFVLQPIMQGRVARGRGDKMPSFYLDLAGGRGQSEVVYHNGAIARAGEAAGVPTPVNAVLNDILLQLTYETVDWREFDGQPGRLVQAVKAYARKMAAPDGPA